MEKFPFDEPQSFDYIGGKKKFSNPLSKEDKDLLIELCWTQSKLIGENLKLQDALDECLQIGQKNIALVNFIVQGLVVSLDTETSDKFMQHITDGILEMPMFAEDSAEVLEILTNKNAELKGNLDLDDMKFKNLITRMQNLGEEE